MSRKCAISGTKHQSGHRVSHANNKTNHKFFPNIQKKKIFVPELGKNISLKVTARMLRTIDKLGLNGALKKYGLKISDVA